MFGYCDEVYKLGRYAGATSVEDEVWYWYQLISSPEVVEFSCHLTFWWSTV